MPNHAVSIMAALHAGVRSNLQQSRNKLRGLVASGCTPRRLAKNCTQWSAGAGRADEPT
jgi:hypothetical protein